MTTRTLTRLALRLRPQAAARATGAARRRGAPVALASGVVAFAVIQVVLTGASLVTHGVRDPIYADKLRQMRRLEAAAPPGTPLVLLMGSSRTGNGFAASRVQAAANEAGAPAVVFNFGVPSAGPVTHLVYLRRLLADGQRPDFLILEVLPPMLAELPDGPYEKRLLKGDMLSRDEIEAVARYDIPAAPLRARWRDAALLPVYEHRFKLVGRFFPSAIPWGVRYDWGRSPDPNGWNVPFVDSVSDADHARLTTAAGREYGDLFRHDLPAGPTVAALRDTLALCRAEGIPVALVLFPEAASFRALYPPQAEAKVATFLAGLTAEFGCPVVDARRWVPDERFSDGHHLLRTGGVIFSDRLGAELILPFLKKNMEGRP